MTSSRLRPPQTPLRNACLLVAAATLGALALHAAGRGVLASPHHWSVHSWQELVTRHGVPTAALVIVRLLALAACLYLAGLGLLTLLLARTRSRTVRRWLAAATPRLLRPTLGVVGALSFATPAHAADQSTPPVMVLVTTTTQAPAPAPTSPPPSMRRIAEAGEGLHHATTSMSPTTSAAPTTPSSTGPVSRPPAPAPVPVDPDDDRTWTVDRGDHFWHIAEATLFIRLGRAPSLQETHGYWRVLVDTNRPNLVDADNPDLLFAGQEIVLPPHR